MAIHFMNNNKRIEGVPHLGIAKNYPSVLIAVLTDKFQVMVHIKRIRVLGISSFKKCIAHHLVMRSLWWHIWVVSVHIYCDAILITSC